MARGKFRPNVVRWNEIDPQSGLPNDDPNLNDYLILAEGDSWFTIGGIPTSNLLFSMRFKKMTMILNCGTPGDTIKHMSEITKNQVYKAALSAEGYPWKLILLSGGGNDLMDEVDDILIPKQKRQSMTIHQPADYCDQGRLDRLISEIQDGYRRLISLRDGNDSPAKGKPVITHTYDYVTPRNSPARFFAIPLLGPWLYKALMKAKVPKKAWIEVADYLIDRLAEGILALQKGNNKLKNFHVIDTRGLLKRAKLDTAGENGDWLNEIHPDFDGYKKLAKALEVKVADLLKK